MTWRRVMARTGDQRAMREQVASSACHTLPRPLPNQYPVTYSFLVAGPSRASPFRLPFPRCFRRPRPPPLARLPIMSFFKRNNPHPDDLNDYDANVDPELRLRTVRTAHSTIAESIMSEQRAERRKSIRKKRSRFFKKNGEKESRPSSSSEAPVDPKTAPQISGVRRNVYVNMPLTAMEVDRNGEPLARYARNKIRTSSKLRFDPSNALLLTQRSSKSTLSLRSYRRTCTNSSDGTRYSSCIRWVPHDSM